MQSKHALIILLFSITIFTSFKNTPGYQESTLKSENVTPNSNDPDGLVGKWMMEGDPETYIDLRSNGAVIEKSIGEPLERYWSIKEKKLCLKASLASDSEVCIEYVLEQDILTLTINKMRLQYIRAKK
ncbi:hypothetical protein [Aquimarina sp. AU119]|uniref:hypothetical protein n=1 Tax=Aquimarina sp. AU119 TaxID=2108528 RepID=UPI000D685E35|nr:hypothetical protein [Aquimarina sp. AU119]